MSQSSSSAASKRFPAWLTSKRWPILILPLFVFVSFTVASLVTALILQLLTLMGVTFTQAVESTITAILVYTLTLLLALGVPWKVRRNLITRRELGVQRMPSWFDLLLAPAGFIVYGVLTIGVSWVVTHLIPAYNAAQPQNVGFSQVTNYTEYILAFVSLVVVAPIAEELLFRGFLLSKLRTVAPTWLAIIIVSALFGALHGAWNLFFDTFTLSVVLCIVRIVSGSLWPSILIHMLKNGLAFYILFVLPMLSGSLGG